MIRCKISDRFMFSFQGRTRDSASSSGHQCCICLSDPVFAVETNCAHLYCASDFFEFFRRVDTGLLGAPSCPYCRQRVTLLLPYFTLSERNAAELDVIEVRTGLLNKVKDFNRRFSGQYSVHVVFIVLYFSFYYYCTLSTQQQFG